MIKTGKERKLVFDKSLRYLRQSVYHISDYESIPFRFAAGEKEVYKNFNLSIFVDDVCNANCKFCVAQLRYENRKLLYRKEHISDDEEYFKRLYRVLSLVRELDPSISITGGEPSISKRLPRILSLIDEFGFRKRTITSNGSGLFLCHHGESVAELLAKHRFDHLNISRCAVGEELNKRIMDYDRGGLYFSNRDLRNLLDLLKGASPKIRLSCLLLKEAVGSLSGLKEYADYYLDLGIDNFIFRQLMQYDHLAVNLEKIRYCEQNTVELNTIWEEMESDPELLPYLNLLGYYYYVEIYKYKNATIASEAADLRRQYEEKAKHPDIVYEMVFHTNGNLCGSWIPEEDVLDPYR